MNVIYIHTHDSGTITGAYGYGSDSSALKDFSKDALLFRKAFTVSPTCSPSRASLLTGLYPHENGMIGLANRGFSLNDYDDHLVNILKKNGYHTVLSGIQHEAGKYTDHERGAKIIGYDENISVDFDMTCESQLFEWDYLNAKHTSEWLKTYDKRKPLFLSFGLFSTHRPFLEVIEKKHDEKYITAPQFLPDVSEIRSDYSKYLESLSLADNCVKDLLQGIKDAGLYDNSIIVFTTDHGIAMPFSKCTLLDQGIGVSFIMRHPEMKTKGEYTDSLISQVDFLPTLIELLNLKHDKTLSGHSFAGVFQNKDKEIRNEIFSEINFHTSYEPVRSIRTKRYKYIRYFDDEYLQYNLSNIDESQSKNYYLKQDLSNRLKDKEQLYDLVYDPTEKNNLVNNIEYNKVLINMQSKLAEYMLKTKDPLLEGSIEVSKNWKVNKKNSRFASSKDPNDYVKH